MKIVLDEHIDPELGEYLAEEGHEAFHTLKYGRGQTDREHLESAKQKDAVIVTRDDDFLSIASKKQHPGIIFLTSYASISKLGEQIAHNLEGYSREDLRNSVLYLPK